MTCWVYCAGYSVEGRSVKVSNHSLLMTAYLTTSASRAMLYKMKTSLFRRIRALSCGGAVGQGMKPRPPTACSIFIFDIECTKQIFQDIRRASRGQRGGDEQKKRYHPGRKYNTHWDSNVNTKRGLYSRPEWHVRRRPILVGASRPLLALVYWFQ